MYAQELFGSIGGALYRGGDGDVAWRMKNRCITLVKKIGLGEGGERAVCWLR